MTKKKETALAPTETSPTELSVVMAAEAEKRALITKYISQHMKDKVDFGTIQIGSVTSKPSLFKPGSEKFMSLFKLTARFRKDSETWEMAGSPKGLFCYVCELINSKGDVVGEGRGAASLDEKRWTPNNAIKIAEKRAQIDAVLRTGALSDFFTQDLEDMAKDKLNVRGATYNVRSMGSKLPATPLPVVEMDEDGEQYRESLKARIREGMRKQGFTGTKTGEFKKAVEDLTGISFEVEHYQDIAMALEEMNDPVAQKNNGEEENETSRD